MNKKNRLARILIPVLIVVIIATMWFIKNRPENGEEPAAEPTVDPLSGADFQLDANGQIDYEALFKYGLPIIVDYGADTCIPCKEMAPVLELLNEEMQGKAFIKFVNVWISELRRQCSRSADSQPGDLLRRRHALYAQRRSAGENQWI